jgi:lysophospholipase L1-like esterase
MFKMVTLAMTFALGIGCAAAAPPEMTWKTSWAASVQGPYPAGNPSAQPDQSFAFPHPKSGARDQSFRLVVKPTLWGAQARIRLSNAFGTRPVRIDGVHLGLQLGSAAVVPGTNQPVTFAGSMSIELQPGASAWSDPVDLPFAAEPAAPLLQGRKLTVSFHVAGESGPMTWHAKALQTSYVSAPGAGAKGADESEAAFPYATASWFFLDALDMRAPADIPVVVGFGDSITDGTASTMNGDDRWPDVLARRLALAFGSNKVAVIDAGIGGNQVAGPSEYGPLAPFAGGPSAVQRLERDVLSLSGVTSLIWLEAINDFSKNGNASVEAVTAGMRDVAGRLKAKGIRVIGATVVSALGSTSPAHGSAEQDQKRKELNIFIRNSGVFDAVVDFDAVTLDAATGGLKPEFVPESTTGGPGDKLHPNRTGYLAMGSAIDPAMVLPGRR